MIQVLSNQVKKFREFTFFMGDKNASFFHIVPLKQLLKLISRKKRKKVAKIINLTDKHSFRVKKLIARKKKKKGKK